MKSIFYLFLFFCLGACTITKRVHNPGWHVEWRTSQSKKQESPKDQDIAGDKTVKSDEHVASGSPSIPSENNLSQKGSQSKESILEPSLDQALTDQQEHQADNVKPIEQSKEDSQPEQQPSGDSPKPEPLGILSILSSSTALIFLLNIFLLLSDNGWNAILGLSYPWLFFIVLAFATIGLILAIKSLKRLKSSPEMYSGKGRAWTGFGMSVGAGGLVVLTLFVVFLVFLFETFFYW
jgi:hypothetical protein